MKRLIGATLFFVFLSSILGCSPAPTDIAATNTQSSVNYSLEDVLIAHAVDMGELTGLRTNSDFLSILGSHDSIIALAQNFSIAATKLPIQAQLFIVEDMERNDMNSQINELTYQSLGETAMGCSNLLLHTTQICLPVTLSENTLVCLKYNEECSIFVLYVPVEDRVTSVYTYAVFNDVANNFLNNFQSTISLNANEIEDSCASAEGAEYSHDKESTIPSSQYYERLALKAISAVSPSNIQDDIPDHLRVYVDHLSLVFTQNPSCTSVYRVTDYAKRLIEKECHFDKFADSSLRQMAITEFIALTPMRMAQILGQELVTTNSIFQAATQSINLGGISTNQTDPVLVVLNYPNGDVCMVCIYGNDYGLLQATFACLPELPQNWNDINPNAPELERID